METNLNTPKTKNEELNSSFIGYHDGGLTNNPYTSPYPYTITTSASSLIQEKEESIFNKVLELALKLNDNPGEVAKRFTKILDIVYGND